MIEVKKSAIDSLLVVAFCASVYFFGQIYICILASILLAYCLHWMSSIVMFCLSKILPIKRLDEYKWEASILISVCIYLVLLGTIIWIIFPALFAQYKNFLTVLASENAYAGIVEYIQNFLNQPYVKDLKHLIEPNLVSLNQDLMLRIIGFAKHFVNQLIFLGSSVMYSTQNLVNISLTFVAAFHIVREWNKWPARVKKLSKLRFISDYYGSITDFIDFCGEKMQSWIQSQIILTNIMWLYYSVCFSILDIASPILLGFLFGYSGLIPYIGEIFSMMNLFVILIIAKSTLEKFIITLAVIWIGNLVNGYFLSPILIGNKTKVNVVEALLGFLINSRLFGVVGVFLNIPFCIIVNGLLYAIFTKKRQNEA